MTNTGDSINNTPDAVTVFRTQEHPEADTVRTPIERVRIRKVIVTEGTVTLTLRREEIVVDRTPLDPRARVQ